MVLSFSALANNPNVLRFDLASGDNVQTLRPLENSDVGIMTEFLQNLSPQTRKFYPLSSYDTEMAQELCSDIDYSDKLRIILVNETPNECIGLFEYSFDIPKKYEIRFERYGIHIQKQTDCRLAFCLADTLQNQGVGSEAFPFLGRIARKLGKKRIVLWGGVMKENARAIRFYRKNGFQENGEFINDKGIQMLDMTVTL